MGGATIICPNCKKSFEISDAIQHQIEDELLRAKTEQSETLRKEYDAAAEIKLKQAVENAISEAQQAAQLQIERERQSIHELCYTLTMQMLIYDYQIPCTFLLN